MFKFSSFRVDFSVFFAPKSIRFSWIWKSIAKVTIFLEKREKNIKILT